MKRFFVIFSFFIVLLFLAGNLCACLEVDINILKETCKDLRSNLIGYDSELAPLNQELSELQIEAESAKQKCTRLIADRNDLTMAGDVLVRIVSELIMDLTVLRELSTPYDIATSNAIKNLVREINEKTLQINFFRSEILKLNDQINVLRSKIISMEDSKTVMETKIRDLQIKIKYDEQSLKEAELSLSSKTTKIDVIEQDIKDCLTRSQTYSNRINILLNRIAALSASQQGSGGVVPEGLEELQSALQAQRVLLADALDELESLHFEHGC